MAIELPEAFVISNQMDKVLRGKTTNSVHVSQECASLIRQGFIRVDPDTLKDHMILGVTSKGKWIFVQFSDGDYLLLALETGGKILFHNNPETVPQKFHIRLDFADGSALTVWIVGWGFAKIAREDALEADRYPGKLGLSPIDTEGFSQQAFEAILDCRKDTIKSVLLDQGEIAGIGNGYAQDILFKAKVHPRRKAAEISAAEKSILFQTIQDTMRTAIRLGGSENEVDLFGSPGNYKKIFGERKKDLTCPACGSRIEKLILGSSTYFCPVCQK
jgi:formamidopyrimidine-DNA glycosylase